MVHDSPLYGAHPDYPRRLARFEAARDALEAAIAADGWRVPRSDRILLAQRGFDNAWAAVLQLDEQALEEWARERGLKTHPVER